MREFFRKYRSYILGGGILLAAFVFFSLNLKNRGHANAFEKGVINLMAPLYGVVAQVNGFASDVWTDYLDLVAVRKENKQLRETVKILNTRLADAGESIQASDRLQKLLQLKSSLHVPVLAASVIGEDGSSWFRTIVIDRGSVDGLREGMPVVATDGVVGQLVRVAAGSSRVLLLTDHSSSIAALVQRSRARGVVKGSGAGRCAMEFTLHGEDVKVGDTVVTSGIGGIFPKGFPVGEVAMVKKGEYGIFQTIEVRPRVAMAKLEEVLVILQDHHD
jgi:rod shape-determining protein MreC